MFHPLNERNVSVEVWKVGSWVDLAQPVMGNGSAHLHVVGERGVRLAAKMEGSSPDVGLICVGYPPTPFPTPLQSIVGDPGAFAFNTVNNIWGDKRTAHYPTAHHDSTVQYSVVVRALRVLTVDVSVVCWWWCEGTNYPMWYPFVEEDHSQQYRVEIRLQRPQ